MPLGKAELIRRVKKDKLVSPLLELEQIQESSIDVRLGHQFLAFNKVTGFKAIDPTETQEMARELERHHQHMIRIGYGREFFLHPGDFVIARTYEYFNLPADIAAYVVGRSSWGRLGVVIATATYVNPGFKGTITLEITNLGQVPVVMIPLMRIAQLVFHQVNLKEKSYVRPLPPSD